MGTIERSVDIDAPVDVVWKLMAERVAYPARFSDFIRDARVVDTFDDGCIWEVEMFGVRRRERVTVAEHKREIRYVAVKGSEESIPRIESVEATPGGARLTLTLVWNPHTERLQRIDDDKVERLVDDVLGRVKEIAEERASA
jgi:hypothetical protein